MYTFIIYKICAENEREHQAIALNGLIIIFRRQKRINYETPMHS